MLRPQVHRQIDPAAVSSQKNDDFRCVPTGHKFFSIAGLGVWGGVNLLEGYGSDNPGANAHVP